MSKHEEHKWAGIAFAGTAGAVTVHSLDAYKAAPKFLGYLAGGKDGARLPDRLDPPGGFNHWQAAHSIFTGLAVATACTTAGEPIRNSIDELGNFFFDQQNECQDSALASFCWGMAGLLTYFAGGYLHGYGVGYLSHLVLDQVNSKSDLPLWGKLPPVENFLPNIC